MSNPQVVIYTDGAYSRSHNVGGYAYLLKCNGVTKSHADSVYNTTNNRMELLAVIEGLKALKRKCNVVIYSDSTYVVDTINKWIGSFISDPTRANYDLIFELYKSICKHDEVEAIWIRGHSGNVDNELVNDLAQAEVLKRKELKEKFKDS